MLSTTFAKIPLPAVVDLPPAAVMVIRSFSSAQQVSISTSTSTLAQTTAAAGKQWIHSARSDRSARSSPPAPPPGMSAFPTLKNLPEEGDDDGDAMLDALLGMETPSNETSTGSFERALVPGKVTRYPMATVLRLLGWWWLHGKESR